MPEFSLRVSIIGAGNVAYGLGMAIKKIAKIDYIYSRSSDNSKTLASKLSAGYTNDIRILSESDLIIIAVTDTSIHAVAQELEEILKNSLKAIVVHTSGSIEMNALSRCSNNYGVFYPLQTFTKGRKISLKNVPLLINSNNDYVEKRLMELGSLISNVVVRMDDESRNKIHLPAVFINNFVNHLVFQSEKLIEEYQLEKELFMPLLEETIKKLKKSGAFYSQTGPAIRNDERVIEKQMDALKQNPQLLKFYKLFTASIKETYHENPR